MQVAKAFGATDVAISDVNEHRLSVAERMGATRILRAGRDVPGEVDAVIECSGHPAALVAGSARTLRLIRDTVGRRSTIGSVR